MRLIVFSKALYSTWLYYSPDRILFDAGEGISTVLGNKCFAIEQVFLSHGHADHTAGLPGLVNIRNSGMGDTQKPLCIYYPDNNWRIAELADYISRTNRKLDYHLDWQPLRCGERIAVFQGRNARHIECFRTVHSKGEESLGFNVVEERSRLKPEYRDCSEEEIRELARSGRKAELLQTYCKKLLSYGGDSIPLDPNDVAGTDILCHDATFIVDADRKEYKHATLAEAVEVAVRAEVQESLLAMHISSRYGRGLAAVEERFAQEYPLKFKVRLVPPGKVYRYD